MEATTVAAQGVAEDSFDHAIFNLSLSGLSTSPTQAKQLLANSIAELNSAIDQMKSDLNLEFVKNSVQTNSSVAPKHEWVNNVQEFVGHQMSYSLSFEIDNLDLVNQVYDTLTSLETVSGDVRISVGGVGFNITPKTRERLNKKALKKAFQNVQDRFDAECVVLGLDSTLFEIATWETSYSDSRRSNRVSDRLVGGSGRPAAAPMARALSANNAQIEASAAFGSAGDDVPMIEITVGLASVTVNLEVAYQRKPQTISK